MLQRFFSPSAGRRTAMGRGCLLVLTALISSTSAVAQTGMWTAHTSMREVTSLDVGGDALWVGTTGGVFSYAPSTGEIRRFTIAEGLHGIQVRAVAYDPACVSGEPCVWVGYSDGVLDRIDLQTRAVDSFRDIERADRFSTREINRILVHGDSLLIATSFGLVVFDSEKVEVRDSYTQFGGLLPATAAHDAMVAPGDDDVTHLWIATESGVAHAPLNAPNLKDPASWIVETSGLTAIATRSLTFFGGAVHVGTVQGVSARQPGGSYRSLGVTGNVVPDLLATPDRLIGIDQFALLSVEAGGLERRMVSERFSRPVAIAVGPEGALWIGDQLEGLVELAPLTTDAAEPQVVQTLFPEGPYHNLFSELAVDPDGRLWASGVALAGTGVYRMDESGSWTDFISRERTELQGRGSYVQIHAHENGEVWAGSIGDGLIRIQNDDAIEVYTSGNSSLEGVVDSNFIIIGGIGADPQGRVWATSHASNRPLNVRLEDGSWTNFALHECEGLTAVGGTYEAIFVDSFGQLWFDVKSRADLNQGIGLLVVNPLGTPTDTSDDVCQYFGTLGSGGSGMPGLEVRAFAEDEAGLMWVGTDRGLAYFINNGLVAHDNAATPIWPQHEDRSQGVFMFQGLPINDLAVDPANQVWVATNAGAYLIRQAGSGFEEVAHWTSSNSPLLSDGVVAVTVVPETGEVFFSTDRGLVSYQGEAIAASDRSRDLVVYPNPVRVASDEEPAIFIEGLVEETEIMILAPQGALVTRFMARGGRARWDGRDDSGRLVPSGMYLVVAIGQNGEERAFGKVGIVR